MSVVARSAGPALWATAALCCLVGSPGASSAQSAADELGTWLIYNGTHRLSDRWTVFTEGQLRLYEVAADPQEVLLRVAPQFDLTPDAFIGLGYTRSWGRPFEDGTNGGGSDVDDTTENRLHEQLTLKQGWGATALEHQYRLEQRWKSQGGETTYSNRVRYRFQATVPLSGPLRRSGTVFATLSDEIFIDVDGTPSFNQNRLYVAAGYHLSARSHLQLGYLYQSTSTENLQRLQVYFTLLPRW